MYDINLKGGERKMYQTCCEESSMSLGHSRNFLTKEEKIQILKDYKQSLEDEAKGVAERIDLLEKE